MNKFLLIPFVALILLLLSIGKKILVKRKTVPDGNIVKATGSAIKDFFVPADRYLGDIKDLPSKSLGGQPQFYNEVDHSYGRFVGWVRTKEDLADDRVIQNNFYRAKIRIDVKYFWFVPGHKDQLTPCVFRPGLDAVFKGPGEEVGIPAEGLVIIKRSLDGTRLATGVGERFRQMLLDEKHKNKIMADMMLMIRDKERLVGGGDLNKAIHEELENTLKRTKKLHDAAVGRHEMGEGGMPYGREMYGDEEAGVGGVPGSDVWNFQY